ncbi:MAG: RICIN domain-containing protein, partial [Polyangia bacterium]
AVSTTTCIGGGTFDPNFFTDPVRAQVQAELQKPTLVNLEHMLRNLAYYGQPGDPVPDFGALHIALRRDTNAVDGTDPTDGARPQLKAWSETAPTMRWAQENDGTLRNEVTGKCLEVYGWSQDNGAAITTWSCHGGANQRWQQINGNVFRNVNSGKCLTDQVTIFRWGTHASISHSLVQNPCDGSAAQSWKTATRDVAPPR